MHFVHTWFTAIALLLSVAIQAAPASQSKIKTLYNSLDPSSISQHLAFYELYSHSIEGMQALQDAWRLLTRQEPINYASIPHEYSMAKAIEGLIALVNKRDTGTCPKLSDNDLEIMEHLSQQLPHKKLKGHDATTEEEVLALPPQEIDLARGLLLGQLEKNEASRFDLRIYEAFIDLMALQILARLPPNAEPAIKIRAINDFVFNDMGFRFPPHSAYAKEIDLYTFLPSVLDSRRGVCLGVSILYICLAQRLDLQLEMVTPPGHIYVRYHEGETEINIETTARGVHLDSEEYLSMSTKGLQQRSIKDVIGLAYFNQASVFLSQEKYTEALGAYQHAHAYLPQDKLLLELMAFQYLFVGEEEKGRELLEKVKDYVPDWGIDANPMAADYLAGKTDIETIKATFKQVDETRESILAKRNALLKALERSPQCRTTLFHLATTWLQLHRQGEALQCLERYHALDPNDVTNEYYLTMLYAERMHYSKAWKHFRQTEGLLKAKDYQPKLLKEIKQALTKLSPE